MEIFNYGKLPRGWTVDTLTGKHESLPVNNKIARAFYSAGFIEKWGCGIETILSECRDAGIADPEFRLEDAGIRVVFTAKKREPATMPCVDRGRATLVTENESAILALLEESDGMTASEIYAASPMSAGRTRYAVARLSEKGLIAKENRSRRGKWKTTEKSRVVSRGDGSNIYC
jgi:ATP-dependent DNA helicase RecG